MKPIPNIFALICLHIVLGLCIQAMDTANVCLVSMDLSHEGFDPYRCDKNIILGVNLAKSDTVDTPLVVIGVVMFVFYVMSSFLKIIRCGGNDDAVTLKCQDNSDSLGIVIEDAG